MSHPQGKMAKRSQGRQAADGATSVERVTVTLTKQDRDKLRALGGSVFVRGAIRAATLEEGNGQQARD